jgi:hypothetical protein
METPSPVSPDPQLVARAQQIHALLLERFGLPEWRLPLPRWTSWSRPSSRRTPTTSTATRAFESLRARLPPGKRCATPTRRR